MKGRGALPAQMMRDMIAAGFIPGASVDRVQPASLDLTVSERVYRVGSVFQPWPGETIEHAMQLVSPEEHDLRRPLEVDITYLIRLNESLKLPEQVYAYANPKSSTGRNDIHVRMLADGITRFDSASSPGYRGALWTLVTPRSFRVRLNPGDSLQQLRLFNADTRFTGDDELQVNYELHRLLYTPAGKFVEWADLRIRDRRGALILTINLDLDVVGYSCEGSQKVLDFSKRNEYNPADFFQPIPRPKGGTLTLRRGDFYILSTGEFLRVPGELAADMEPVDIRAGDYRAQYAGYFDPGWGFGPDGDILGAPAVLEVRSFEENLTIRHGQPICRMTFERMTTPPDTLYGAATAQSHYLRQSGPALSKHFRQL